MVDSIFRILLLCIAGLFSLGQIQRIELPAGRAFYFHEIGITIFLLLLFLTTKIDFITMCRKNRIAQSIFFWNVWIVATSIFHFFHTPTELGTSLLYLARFDVLLLFGFGIYLLRKKSVIHSTQIQLGMFASLVSIAVFGFFQYFFFPDTRNLRLLGWDDHYLRLLSTLFDPGFTGVLLAIGTLLLIKRSGSSPFSSIKTRILFHTSWIICAVALLFTYSRASFIAFAVGCIYLFTKKRELRYVGILVVFIMGIFLLPRANSEGTRLERSASAIARVESVNRSFETLTISQVFVGKGWYYQKKIESVKEGMSVPNHASAPENSFVFLFTSLGIVGVLSAGCVLFFLCQHVQWNGDFLLALCVVLTHSLFSNTLFHSFVLLILATIMGYSAPLLRPSSQSAPRSVLE